MAASLCLLAILWFRDILTSYSRRSRVSALPGI